MNDQIALLVSAVFVKEKRTQRCFLFYNKLKFHSTMLNCYREVLPIETKHMA